VDRVADERTNVPEIAEVAAGTISFEEFIRTSLRVLGVVCDVPDAVSAGVESDPRTRILRWAAGHLQRSRIRRVQRRNGVCIPDDLRGGAWSMRGGLDRGTHGRIVAKVGFGIVTQIVRPLVASGSSLYVASGSSL
jgi:hypothetical protein